MQALEDDKYVRQIHGYLPAASVAFIDEIFKANSAILNTLLTVLNERLFDNGTERLTVPLICLVSAAVVQRLCVMFMPFCSAVVDRLQTDALSHCDLAGWGLERAARERGTGCSV